MVKSDLDDVVGWPAPRGERVAAGNWEYALHERPDADCVGEYEGAAVASYRALIAQMEERRAARGWSLRALAGATGVSPSVVSVAMSGAGWPRWPTLEACAAALGGVLRLADESTDVIPTLVSWVDEHPELSGSSVAANIVVRRNTLYDLRKPGRAPSSSTVFALAAWFDTRVVLVAQPHR